jgi:RimJ/RimL family protein N-acetyltransferase
MNLIAPILSTQRLVLRAHRVSDLQASAAMWADAQVVRFIGGVPSTREVAWGRLLRYFGLWPALGYGYWAVTRADSGAFIGEVGLADFKRALDPHPGEMPEAGWAFCPAAHGQGLALEAMSAVLAWADGQLGPRSFCMISPENAASIRLAQKLGYRAAGAAQYNGNPSSIWQRGNP